MIDEPIVIQDTCDVVALVLDQPEVTTLNSKKLEFEDTSPSDTESKYLAIVPLLDESDI